MNLDLISTAAEIVAAVAVVISIIYLAIQVRQSNRQSRLQTHNDTLNHMHAPIQQMLAAVCPSHSTVKAFDNWLLPLVSTLPASSVASEPRGDSADTRLVVSSTFVVNIPSTPRHSRRDRPGTYPIGDTFLALPLAALAKSRWLSQRPQNVVGTCK